MTTLKEIMSRELTTVAPTATVKEAATLMKNGDIGNVLIMEGDTLKGIITDRDIAVRVVAEGKGCDAPVTEGASTDVFTMPCSTSVEEAAQEMGRRQLRRLPVTDCDSGKVAGIVSLGDLAVRAQTGADEQALEGISEGVGSK